MRIVSAIESQIFPIIMQQRADIAHEAKSDFALRGGIFLARRHRRLKKSPLGLSKKKQGYVGLKSAFGNGGALIGLEQGLLENGAADLATEKLGGLRRQQHQTAFGRHVTHVNVDDDAVRGFVKK
jgi:hypothetical protein